jgi:hypothetical protein
MLGIKGSFDRTGATKPAVVTSLKTLPIHVMGRVFLSQSIRLSTWYCARLSAQLGQHRQGQNRFPPVALPPRFPRITQFTKVSIQAPQVKDLPSFRRFCVSSPKAYLKKVSFQPLT